MDAVQPMKWYQLFKYRNVIAICIGFFTLNYSIYFFVTWFPMYLVQERGLSFAAMGWMAMLPPLTGILSEWFGGWLLDYTYKRTKSLDIARKTNFIGVKDTHPVLRHTQRYIQEIKGQYPDFMVFTGYDNNCIPSVISGGNGCIGALSNVYPDMCHSAAEALRNEDLVAIRKIQRQIDKRMKFYEAYPTFNPVMKWALKEMGWPMQENCKVPLSSLTAEEKKHLDAVANELWRTK